MALDKLPVELLLEIFRFAQPQDLLSISGTSRQLHRITCRHDDGICRELAAGIWVPDLLVPIDSGRKLPALTRYLVHRMRAELLIPALDGEPALLLRGLLLLFKFRDDVGLEDAQTLRWRLFMEGHSGTPLKEMLAALTACARLTAKLLVKFGRAEGAWKYNDAVILRGLGPLVALMHGDLKPMSSLRARFGDPRVLAMVQEQVRWDSHLERIGVKKLSSARSPVTTTFTGMMERVAGLNGGCIRGAEKERGLVSLRSIAME